MFVVLIVTSESDAKRLHPIFSPAIVPCQEFGRDEPEKEADRSEAVYTGLCQWPFLPRGRRGTSANFTYDHANEQ